MATETEQKKEEVKIERADVWKVALYVQQESGVIAEFVYRQWAHESDYFTSNLARKNLNLGGLTQIESNGEENKQPDGTNYYCKYESIQEFGEDYVKRFISRYDGIAEAKTLENFVEILKANKYFGDSIENYLAGLQGISLEDVLEPTVDNPIGAKILESAQKHLGHPYSKDSCCQLCTGFVYKAYLGAGIDFDTIQGLPGNFMLVTNFAAWARSANCFSEDKACMIAGDIVVGNDEGHVAIYMGDGNIIHNSSSKEKVIIADGSWMIDGEGFNGFIRIGNDIPLDTRASTVKGSSGTKYAAALGALLSTTSEASGGFTEKMSGKNYTVYMNKKGKTPAEPIYPDYITITNNIPAAYYDNKEIVGSSIKASITLDDMTQSIIDPTALAVDIGISAEMMAAMSDYRKRQMTFDASKHRNTVKSPNPGSPKNPADPYPVDAKIEELELHLKRIKLANISLTKPQKADKQLAKYIIEVSDAAEKRVVKLENILATITRYLFAIGSRMHINCQYYGGQDRFQKYNCIRCLKDDLISDGQVVQIDQCLNCDRYEPIIGQVYDIVNETGFNLAAIQDDMQASMMSMNQFVQLSKVNEVSSKLEPATFVTSNLLNKKQDDLLFAESGGRWSDENGLKMKWDLVPVEEQQAQINWEQHINDNSDTKRVGSYQLDPANMQGALNISVAGTPVGIAPGAMREFFEKSYANLTTDPILKAAFPDSLYDAQASKVEATAANMEKYGYAEALTKAAAEYNLDPLFMFAIITRESNGVPENIGQVENSTATSIEDQLKASCKIMREKFDNSNWKSYVTKIQAYNSLYPEEFFVNYAADAYDSVYYKGLDEYSNKYSTKAIIMEYVPNVIFSYIAAMKNDELLKTLRSTTVYKLGELALPYGQEHFDKVMFTSYYGWRPSTSSNHAGWDFSSGQNLPIIAVADGKCVVHREWEKGYGNYIVIEHKPGLQSLYAHMAQPSAIQIGDEVKEGQIVGYEGKSGGNYPVHLHFGLYKDFNAAGKDYDKSIDPTLYYPQFAGRKNHYLASFLLDK